MRCGHLTYDTWIWLKITSQSSTASDLNGCKKIYAKESLNVHNVKILSNFFPNVFGLFMPFFLRVKACTWHIEWFPWHQEPKRPQWPQQPQQPRWPQWPLQPHFIKKITELDFSINPGTKTTYSALIMWVGSSKTQYFLDFWHPFFVEAVEDRDVTFTQIKGS